MRRLLGLVAALLVLAGVSAGAADAFTISMHVSGHGTVREPADTGANIDCTSPAETPTDTEGTTGTCTGFYEPPTGPAVFTAIVPDGWSFDSWVGCASTGTDTSGRPTCSRGDAGDSAGYGVAAKFKDTTPPTTTIDTGSPTGGSVSNASPTFTFHVDSPDVAGSFACTLDSETATACITPGSHTSGSQSYSSLDDGEHTFSVKATDPSGNEQATATSVTWTVDATPPELTMPGDVTVDAHSQSGAIATYDAPQASDTTSGPPTVLCDHVSGSKFPIGTTTVTCTATDGAGNHTSGTLHVVVRDRATPQTTIKSGPRGLVRSRRAVLAFASSEAGSTFRCRLDGGAFKPCASPRTYTSLRQGKHTFRVAARDAAGNLDPSPAVREWTVDTVAPKVAAVSPGAGAGGVSRQANVLVTFSERMRAASIKPATVKLVDKASGKRVAAAVHYEAATRRAKLDPAAALKPGATYRATVAGGAKDLAGNPLGAGKSWSFTVKAAAAAVRR
jgi:hypothetical protein